MAHTTHNICIIADEKAEKKKRTFNVHRCAIEK